MTKTIEEKNKRYFFISGLLTAVSVNINYLTGCILAPPVPLHAFLRTLWHFRIPDCDRRRTARSCGYFYAIPCRWPWQADSLFYNAV